MIEKKQVIIIDDDKYIAGKIKKDFNSIKDYDVSYRVVDTAKGESYSPNASKDKRAYIVDICLSSEDKTDRSGLEIISRIKEKQPNSLIIALTGFEDADRKVRRLGVNYCYLKTFGSQHKKTINIIRYTIEEYYSAEGTANQSSKTKVEYITEKQNKYFQERLEVKLEENKSAVEDIENDIKQLMENIKRLGDRIKEKSEDDVGDISKLEKQKTKKEEGLNQKREERKSLEKEAEVIFEALINLLKNE